MGVDYTRIGLKVGIEIHCQLDTPHKLFCNCPTGLASGEVDLDFIRRLRPTQSELGEVDPAALFEFQKGKTITYEADRGYSCLVEADEEPPHSLNPEAVETALIIALMVKSTPVDEIHVMRKVVIDGSNTTGFQRTAAIALNGQIDTDLKIIPIEHISLEEDAARKTSESGLNVHYRIDRLCIPLIEIATGPVINTPIEAQEVALKIGRILKSTRRVKRGLGTIRQDLNISLKDGALIEVKGVQKLDSIFGVIKYEVERQLRLIEIKNELEKRHLTSDELNLDFIDLTIKLEGSKSKILMNALKRGRRIWGIKLPKYSGLLGKELTPGVRLGTEMAWRAMFYGGVKGIFHTDELPAYGITEGEKQVIQKSLGADERDACVIVCDEKQKSIDALKAVIERAKEALYGVPEETRAACDDETTRFMRPRPGAARMYPETDIPAVPITEQDFKSVKENLPELPEVMIKRLIKEYGLNNKLANQVLDSDYLSLFEELSSTTKVPSTFTATILTETLKSLERERLKIEILDERILREIFKLVDEGKTAKESVENILRWMTENPGKLVKEALKTLGLEMITEEDLNQRLDALLNENDKIIADLKEKSIGKLTGLAMKKLRGKSDPRVVISLLEKKVKERLTSS